MIVAIIRNLVAGGRSVEDALAIAEICERHLSAAPSAPMPGIAIEPRADDPRATRSARNRRYYMRRKMRQEASESDASQPFSDTQPSESDARPTLSDATPSDSDGVAPRAREKQRLFVDSEKNNKNNDGKGGNSPPAARAVDLGGDLFEVLRCAPRLRAALAADLGEEGTAAGWADLSRLIASRIGDICDAYSTPSRIGAVLWRRAAERHGEMALVALAYALEAHARGKVGLPAQWMNWFSRRETIDVATNLAALRQFTAEDERAAREAARIEKARREQASRDARKGAHQRAALALRGTVHELVAMAADREAADYAERAIMAHVAVAGDEHGAPRRVFWMGRVDDRARAILDQAMIAHGLPAAALEIDRVMPTAVKLAALSCRPRLAA